MLPALPTIRWRKRRDEEQQELNDGDRPANEAFLTRIHPDAFLASMESIFTKYVQAIQQCDPSPAGFPQVMNAIKDCVLAVNHVNRNYDGFSVETDEREVICAFIENVIIASGIDISGLAAANNCTLHELTDQWRDW